MIRQAPRPSHPRAGQQQQPDNPEVSALRWAPGSLYSHQGALSQAPQAPWELRQESGPTLLPQRVLGLPTDPCPAQPRRGHPHCPSPPKLRSWALARPPTPALVPATPAQILPCTQGASQGSPPAHWTMDSVGSPPGSPPTLYHPILSPGSSKEFVTNGSAVGLAGKRVRA